mgnify:FL=1
MPCSVKEAVGKEDGEQIIGLSGTIKAVFAQPSDGKCKCGKDHGEAEQPWFVQGLILKDGTGEVECSIWNRNEIPRSASGKKVVISSIKGKRGWAGCKKETKNGKKGPEPRIGLSEAGSLLIDGIEWGEGADPEPAAEATADSDPGKVVPVTEKDQEAFKKDSHYHVESSDEKVRSIQMQTCAQVCARIHSGMGLDAKTAADWTLAYYQRVFGDPIPAVVDEEGNPVEDVVPGSAIGKPPPDDSLPF